MPYNPIFGGGSYSTSPRNNDSTKPLTSQPLPTPTQNRVQQQEESTRSLLSGRRGSLPDDLSTLDLLQPHVASLFTTKLQQQQHQQHLQQLQQQQQDQQKQPPQLQRSSSVGRSAMSISMGRPIAGFFSRASSSSVSPPAPVTNFSRSAGFSFPGDFSISPGVGSTLSQTLARSSSWRGGEDCVYGELTTQLSDLISAHTADYQQGLAQAVSDKLQDLQVSSEELYKKEQECNNLKKVMRDLAITRAEAITLKVQLSESYNRLHQEYCRVMRSAQLAQAAAKCSTIKMCDLKKELTDTQDKLLCQKKQVLSLTERNSSLRSENAALQSQVNMLERQSGASECCWQSASMRELSAQRSLGLY